MVTTKLSYSHTIGIASFEGRGFMNPIDVKFKNDHSLLLKKINHKNVPLYGDLYKSDLPFHR